MAKEEAQFEVGEGEEFLILRSAWDELSTPLALESRRAPPRPSAPRLQQMRMVGRRSASKVAFVVRLGRSRCLQK